MEQTRDVFLESVSKADRNKLIYKNRELKAKGCPQLDMVQSADYLLQLKSEHDFYEADRVVNNVLPKDRAAGAEARDKSQTKQKRFNEKPPKYKEKLGCRPGEKCSAVKAAPKEEKKPTATAKATDARPSGNDKRKLESKTSYPKIKTNALPPHVTKDTANCTGCYKCGDENHLANSKNCLLYELDFARYVCRYCNRGFHFPDKCIRRPFIEQPSATVRQDRKSHLSVSANALCELYT